jgi:DNA-binding MarR family transcriptional regulator
MSNKDTQNKQNAALPEALTDLPMYLMLRLTREGYQHAVRSKLKFRMPDYAVLALLAEFGALDQKTIGERLQFDKSDITKIINSLESEGIVERKENKNDGRSHLVSLTSKGRKQTEEIGTEISKSMRQFLSGLSSGEYEQLGKLLRKALVVYDDRFEG